MSRSQRRQAFGALQVRRECRGAEAGRARGDRRAGRFSTRGSALSETAPPTAKVERAPPGIEVAPAEAQKEDQGRAAGLHVNDFVSHCSWIAPNNPEILQCLKANTADLSPNCRAAVQSLPVAPPPAAAAPAEPVKQAAPAKKPVKPKPAEPARASAPPAPSRPQPQRRRNRRRSRRPPSAPLARPISCPVALACSRAAPKHCSVSSATRRSSRQRAAVPWPRSAAVRRRRHHPEDRRQRLRPRSRPSDRCRCCACARRWRSCKSAVSKCGRSVQAFHSAAAVSSVASPQTHRACRRAVMSAERGGG